MGIFKSESPNVSGFLTSYWFNRFITRSTREPGVDHLKTSICGAWPQDLHFPVYEKTQTGSPRSMVQILPANKTIEVPQDESVSIGCSAILILKQVPRSFPNKGLSPKNIDLMAIYNKGLRE